MTTDSFYSALHRVRRAEEHLSELYRLLFELRERYKYSVFFKPNPDTPDHIQWGLRDEVIRVPPTIGVIVGETCYNLRGALDYLIFALATLDSGSEQAGTQFPIEDRVKGFEHRKARGWLSGINPAHLAAIERLQPYKGCKWTAVLRDISNRDKHREFAKIQGQIALFVNNPEFDSTLVLNTVTTSGEKVQMQIHVAVQILFVDGASITEALEEIKTGVADTLETFKPDFERR
jgi:hypothetical protein